MFVRVQTRQKNKCTCVLLNSEMIFIPRCAIYVISSLYGNGVASFFHGPE